MEIRNATSVYSKTQAILKREYEYNLQENFQIISENIDKNHCEEKEIILAKVKDELEKINAIKTEGYRVRSKAEFIEHNERSSTFFFNLEKKNALIKNITRLKKDNSDLTDTYDILNELSAFYKKLYTASKYDSEFEIDFLSESLPQISNNDKLLCENEITLTECTKALDKMKGNKSPGTDGITVEFYQYFWKDISDLVLNSIKTAFKNEVLSCEQKRGVIRLIPKKDKDLTDVRNWRPISLLNTDYKIIAHVLASRLQQSLPNIISKDQSGYLKTRNISLNIRTIYDIINDKESKNSSALVAFIDFEKAFDKLNWTFLQNALTKFGFGETFKLWVKILCSDIESCVINNGVTSKYFEINAGVRQGCPLSALLFLIAVETLAISIRKNDDIRGVHIGDKVFKITQLADDTTLFLNDIDSLKNVLKVLEKFRNTSGLKLNNSKTEILQLGVPLTSNYTLLNLKWEKKKIYALGSWFYKDHNKSIIETHEKRLDILQSTINLWTRRNLSWIGRITVIKTQCISKINYAISSIETPDWFINRAENLLNNFLWNGKPPRVKQNVMFNDYDHGGLRMTNLLHFIKAQKINWIKRLLNNKETVPYVYVSQFINMDLKDYLKCSLESTDLPPNLPQFYREVLSDWFAIKKEPKHSDEVQREILWNNKYIKIDSKSLFNKKLYENGLIFINDLIEDNGNVITYDRLIQKFGNNITQYRYICLVHAIPKRWRTMLKKDHTININPKEETVFIKINKSMKPITVLKSKQVYWFLNLENIELPSCIKKWFDKYLIEFSPLQWKKIFTLSKSLTNNTKLIEFQFKIIHRVYASNSYVSNFDNTVSKTCILCNVDNNIPHLFVDCIKVKLFWENLKAWLNIVEGKTIPVKTVDIIFGIITGSSKGINFCILQAKWYIHLNKQKDDQVIFANFLCYLKGVLVIERQIAVNQKSIPYFNATFHNVLNHL